MFKNLFSKVLGLRVFRVTGDSMLPVLARGDYVLTAPFKRIKPDSLIVIQHASYGVLVKRVIKAEKQRYLLSGENSASVSTDQMGWIERSAVLGVVIWSVRR